MAIDEALRSQLKTLRDRLAEETPRARSWASAAPDLVRRLQEALDRVSGAYRLLFAPGGASPEALEETAADAVAEAHLALHGWEDWQAQRQRKTIPPRPQERRASERVETAVTVKLVRHCLRADTLVVTLEDATVSRPARNASLGGIYVTAPRADLPGVEDGHVLHLLVSPAPTATPLRLRAVVVRREEQGMALRWLTDAPAAERAVRSLMEAIRAARSGGGR